jgi:nucleoside-triphosphatase
MEPASNCKIYLSGVPGAGKTTVVRKTADRLRKRGVRLWGFITEEVTDDKARTGFTVSTFDGAKVPFAHVLMKRGPRVGPYRIDVTAFEGMVIPNLTPPTASKGRRLRSVGMIDEIGKMECMSRSFCERLQHLIEQPGCVLISLAVKGHNLISEIRRRAGDNLIEVSQANREMLPKILAETFWAYLSK